jgi:hypothetical protein
MRPQLARRLARLAPTAFATLLWIGLPASVSAEDWTHGRHHRHQKHRHHKHHEHHKHRKHRERHHHRDHRWDWRGHGGSGYRHHPGWRAAPWIRFHRDRHSFVPGPAFTPAPAYYCRPCHHYYRSYDGFCDHVHRHHHVPRLHLPSVFFETSFGFAFHG